MSDSLNSSQQKLNEEFFLKQNAQLLERLREEINTKEQIQKLGAHTGIQNTDLLSELLKAKITPETMPAIKLVPLVMVAWGDKMIQPRERELITQAAAKSGVEKGSHAYALLEGWLQQPPPASLFKAWKDYVANLCTALSPAGVKMLRDEVIEAAHEIARSAGGVLGINAVNMAETKVLKDIAAAFPAA